MNVPGAISLSAFFKAALVSFPLAVMKKQTKTNSEKKQFMMGRDLFSIPVQNIVHLGGEARATGAGHTGHLASTVKKQSNGCTLLLSSLFPSIWPRIPAREMVLPTLCRFLHLNQDHPPCSEAHFPSDFRCLSS